ncbi:uncharacterized protein RHO25_006550 [Cercospora beticola]|uniref:Uncharacterized protein n=1 Tax=Cercospora beticola TaxID=122368 RepID=A0ABZ0NQR7_CERBT|nr:hypothetical protein RHO25_006550 [Cercospora beticola]CAK1363238.1 unnamed protein product [Cercospora beticola]
MNGDVASAWDAELVDWAELVDCCEEGVPVELAVSTELMVSDLASLSRMETLPRIILRAQPMIAVDVRGGPATPIADQSGRRVPFEVVPWRALSRRRACGATQNRVLRQPAPLR